MPTSDFILRDFTPADIGPITAIYHHYVKTSVVTFDAECPPRSAMAEKFNAMAALGHPLVVAEANGQVLGYAYASTYRPRAAYRFTCENSVYLAPEATGQGFGSALLGEVIVRAKAFGFHQMIAVISEGTDASVALHAKHGFALLGRFPELGYKFDRWIGVIHMQRGL